jgi:hypothetical protein
MGNFRKNNNETLMQRSLKLCLVQRGTAVAIGTWCVVVKEVEISS